MRLTNLGLQMRGAVESRRLIELDGVNAGRVVAAAWAISGLMAGLAGVLLAPIYGQLQSSDYAALMVAAFAAAAWAVLRSMPIAALVGILMGVTSTVLAGLPAGQQRVVLGHAHLAALHRADRRPPVRARSAHASTATKDPLSSVDPPTPPDRQRAAGPPDRPGRPGGLVHPAGGVRRVDADLAPDHLGERLQRRPGLLDRLPVHHPDHRHGRPALAGPGHPGRRRAPTRPPSWPPTSASACCSAAWSARWRRPWWPWCWPSPRSASAASAWPS